MTALALAFQALAANKLRTILTMLGTIIGVTCVVALWNIGESGRRFMSATIDSLGPNMIFVNARYNTDEEDQRRNRFRPLTLQDAQVIADECPSLEAVSPMLFSSARISFGANSSFRQIYGCFPSYLQIRSWNTSAGVPFTEADVKGGARVVLLGATVARELFGALDPIDQKVRINQIPFRVLGVLEPKGSNFGDDQDTKVLAPFNSVAQSLGWGRNVHMIWASAIGREAIPQAKNEILLAVRKSQKIPPDRKDSVSLQDMGEIAQKVDSFLIGVTGLLGAIGAISLLVGGVGIMNIMLVSVTERTREIGLRMALGATDRDVLLQFLIEAMVLSGLGGIVGMAFGIGVAALSVRVLSSAMNQDWALIISVPSLAIAMLFSFAVGIFFGFYPAWRASRLDPIVALRHE